MNIIPRHSCSTCSGTANIFTPGFSGWSERLPAIIARARRLIPGSVTIRMRSTISQFKIVDMIVGFIAIDMMNKFIRSKRSTKMLRHNEPMFWNVSKLGSHWVIGGDKSLSVSIYHAMSPSKSITGFAKPAFQMRPCFSSFTHFFNLARVCHYGN